MLMQVWWVASTADMTFDGLGVGDLFERACMSLGCSPSPHVLIDALNDTDDPRQALIAIIGSASQSKDDAMLVDEVALDEIFHRAEASRGAKVSRWLHAISQLSLRPGGETYADKARAKLRDALSELEQHVGKRQAGRKTDISTGAALDPIIQEKLTTPAKALSPQASRDCLVRCIEHGRLQARRASKQSLVVVLGNTGAGKSAFINLLHGCTFGLTDEGKMAVSSESPVSELMRIGHSNKSETFAPQVEPATATFGAGFAFADCPGFLDNRGFEINVANAVNVKQAIAAATSVRVVVIINYYSLLADRGKGVKDLLTILSGLFGTAENVIAHAGSVLLAISQAPVTHPEIGKALTLDVHRQRLLDPSGLDEEAQALLGTLGANVIIYHLMQRGDPSWHGRSGIIERIKRLIPITAPGPLFRSAIDEADKESLRVLVHGLGGQVRQAMIDGQYDAAADLVADLLELRLVENDFVATIVEGGVNGLMDERMARLRTLLAEAEAVEGGGEEKEEEGADEEGGPTPLPTDPQERFEEARKELRELSAVLAAFAGIREVRERLEGLLADATLQLESSVKKAAEAVGRRTVDEPLRDVLRAVGDNVVREVLWLPARAAEMHKAQLEERARLEATHTSDLRALHSRGASEEEMDGAGERYGVLVHEATIHAEAANETWRTHIANAHMKLARRDEALMADEGSAFWSKVGSTSERLNSEAGPVDWARKRVNDDDCEVISIIFRSFELRHLKMLILSSNIFGDAGVTALADATAFGALPCVEKLFLDNNQIGDVGLTELAGAMASGRLSTLIFLDLNRNAIGDDGMSALARAIEGGALSNLVTLYLHANMIGDAGTAALASVIVAQSVLPKLEKLWLYKNSIDDRGLFALTTALSNGGLTSLKSLQLEGNPAKKEVQQAALDVVKQRMGA